MIWITTKGRKTLLSLSMWGRFVLVNTCSTIVVRGKNKNKKGQLTTAAGVMRRFRSGFMKIFVTLINIHPEDQPFTSWRYLMTCSWNLKREPSACSGSKPDTGEENRWRERKKKKRRMEWADNLFGSDARASYCDIGLDKSRQWESSVVFSSSVIMCHYFQAWQHSTSRRDRFLDR